MSKRIRSAYEAARLISQGEEWPTMSADLRKMVPRWHFEMLADRDRNSALLDAIGTSVQPGDLVLDIGTGAGLTALAAARAGASRVVTCESNPVVAELARQVVRLNGYGDRINVITGQSSELEVTTYGALRRKADVLIAEVFDADLFSEGGVQAIDDARRLLEPGAAMLPRSGEVWCRLVESPSLADLNQVSTVEGFDLTPFNRVSTQGPMYVHTAHHSWYRLTEPVRLFELDFTEPAHPDEVCRTASITGSGVLHAAIVWFKLELDGGNEGLGNHPLRQSHWKQTVFTLPGEWADQGMSAKITSRHDTRSLTLSVELED